MKRAKIISISNHKGGVGKTTTTISMGAALARSGARVLLVDLDAQCNLSQSLRVNSSTIYGAMVNGETLRPAQISENLYAVAASELLVNLQGALSILQGVSAPVYALRETLMKVAGEYDYILLDTPPALGFIMASCFAASDAVIIPMQAHYLALNGLASLTKAIEEVKASTGSRLCVAAVVITMFDRRKTIHRDIYASVQDYFGEVLCKTTISDNVALTEAPAVGTDIFSYSKSSKGAKDYAAFVEEISGRLQALPFAY